MYDIKLLPNERIIHIIDDILLKKENKPHSITAVVTDKRLLLLDYPSPMHNFEEDMRVGKGAEYLKKKEEIYSTYLENIVNIIPEEKYNKYILKDSNYFYLLENNNKIKEHIDGNRIN